MYVHSDEKANQLGTIEDFAHVERVPGTMYNLMVHSFVSECTRSPVQICLDCETWYRVVNRQKPLDFETWAKEPMQDAPLNMLNNLHWRGKRPRVHL